MCSQWPQKFCLNMSLEYGRVIQEEVFLFSGEVRVAAHTQTLPEFCELWLLLQGSVFTGT